MTWLTSDFWQAAPAGERFAELLRRPGIVRAPGAHNALAGLLAKRAGFECLYVSGGAVTASLGLPDLGVLTIDDLCFVTRSIYRATGLPLIVDGDTGYGEALNVMRLVRELEAAGAAAVHIEDQILPKKCGHLNDKRLASPEEMAAKVAAARKARSHLRIIARTDAVASEGLEGGIRRAKLYLEAGADIVFPDAVISEADFRTFVEGVGGAPVMANMTEFGRTPYFTADEFQAFGCRIVIWPVSSLRIEAKAVERLYATIASEGSTKPLLDDMQTRADLYATIGYSDYEALDSSIAQSVVPADIRAKRNEAAE
jgi:methylisocitrate lyase